MAKFEGLIEKINNKEITISNKKYTTAKNENLKKGDYVKGDENKGKIVNIKKVELPQSKPIQNQPIENVIINKITETNKKEEKIEIKLSTVKEIKIVNSEVVKKSVIDSEIDIIDLIKIEGIFNNTEKLQNYIEKIIFFDNEKLTISKAQFSAFENELERVNFNFYSESITKFIDERIKRDKAPKFYKSFKSEVLESIRMLESEFGLGDLDQKHKNKFNRKFFEYLKKYYRYKLVLKEKENSIKGE